LGRPRNGRNLNASQIGAAGAQAFNIDPVALAGIATQAFQIIGGVTTVDLEDLNVHGATEHDASLSRDDLADGDTLLANVTRVDEYLIASALENGGRVNVNTLSHTRLALEELSPPLNALHVQLTLIEAGILLLVTTDGIRTGEEDMTKLTADPAVVRYFIANERLPTEVGWQRSPVVVQLTWMREIAASIGAAMAFGRTT
jgi:hypothetical protein